MNRVRLAVIGGGHLGRIHARLLAQMADVVLVGVADVQAEARRRIAEELRVPVFDRFHAIDQPLDGVIIASPTMTHFELARECLQRKLPVLAEKPLTPTSAEAKILTKLARDQGVPLQVGHVERFNSALRTCAMALDNPRFLATRRTGPFSGRSTDIGAVLDLMIHDIDLILSLVQSDVKSVRAFALSLYGGHEDVAQAEIEFVNGALAHCMASRCDTEPARTMQVIDGSRHWNVNLHAASVECLTATGLPHPKAVAMCHAEPTGRVDQAAGIPQRYEIPVAPANALVDELREFIAAIRGETVPTVSGLEATHALAVAERILDDARRREGRWSQMTTGAPASDNAPAALPWRRKAG